MTKLNEKKIRWILRWKERGKPTKSLASAQKITPRRAQQLWKEYKRGGEMPVLKTTRRPRKELAAEEKHAIEKAYGQVFLGAKFLRHHIRVHHGLDINHDRIHVHMLEKGLAKEDSKKKKKRKRCRYERSHSCSLLHADWLEHKGKQVIAFEDDA